MLLKVLAYQKDKMNYCQEKWETEHIFTSSGKIVLSDEEVRDLIEHIGNKMYPLRRN